MDKYQLDICGPWGLRDGSDYLPRRKTDAAGGCLTALAIAAGMWALAWLIGAALFHR